MITCLNEWKPTPNCNNCAYVSITEEEQEVMIRPVPGHVCRQYNRTVKHLSSNLKHNTYIHPCKECAGDKYCNFKERG